MNKILIMAEKENDLSDLFLKSCTGAEVHSFTDYDIPFENFDSVCILAGTEEKHISIPARNRIKIEKMIEDGKRVFCEFVFSIGCVHGEGTQKTTHHRLVYSDKDISFTNLSKGDILDGHHNDLLLFPKIEGAKTILAYHDYLCAHDHIEMDDETFDSGKPALWFLKENILISGFRLCNFNRARFAPMENWHKIIKGIVEFVAGDEIDLSFPEPVCISDQSKKVVSSKDVNHAVLRGLNWFKNANILIDNGKNGVYEGFSHLISARDGKQNFISNVRADCTGETGGAFLLDYMLTGNKESYEIFKNAETFCFDCMQAKDGEHKGMMRWTTGAWEMCFQDDVSRAILPTLLAMNFASGSSYFKEALDALDYMLKTTPEDGLRVAATTCRLLTAEELDKIKQPGAGWPCAHFNAYYHAALILATRAGADKKYADMGIKGLASIMATYPETRRETSETEEMCRLIFPLAVLYEYTKEKEHYNWLCRVTKDLERLQYPTLGYAEWDTGHTAFCARNDKGECALLAHNGDPVADLLYSNNWLPLGFAYAYMATRDKMFYKKWQDIATFMLAAQIKSKNLLLDGAWARAIDLNRMEIYGVPHDIGWAPCCIESGWTVAEILMGLEFMQIAEKELEK